MLRRLYDWILSKASHPHAAGWLAFFAFADGGLFPFPPHPLLALMCLAEPKKAVRFALITTVASLFGGLLGYAIGHFVYDTVGNQLLGALGLTNSFPKAACYLREYGAEIIVFKAATPIPFILISMTAGFISFPLLTFAAASLVSRGVIFLTIGILFRLFGPPIKLFIDKYLHWLVVGFIVVFASGYIAFAMMSGGAKATADKCDHSVAAAAKA